MDIFRFTEIAEAGQPILNPFTSEQMRLLGSLCELRAEQSILDLGCGKGELLCTWSREHGTRGVGVDVYEPFTAEAEHRARALGVADRVKFVTADAGAYEPDHKFHVVACIGSAWVGGSMPDTLDLMRRHAVADDPLLLVGEPFHVGNQPPKQGRTSRALPELVDVFSQSGLDVVEMVMASQEGWDRYRARKWWTVDRWLRHNPASPEAAEVREHLDRSRHDYLHGERDAIGWGVFVLRVTT